MVRSTQVAEILGIKELWAETLGDPGICVAILDGPVDRSHSSLAAANLAHLGTLVSGTADRGAATRHGTHVASVIFGQHDGPVQGIAPRCRGIVVPVFGLGPDDSLAPCSQLDLARAILQALQAGANIINISGGEISPSGTAQPILAEAVRKCIAQGVLIVAAAGNQGCDCLHVPGGLPSVLAVGAMDSQGEPLAYSNWGERYHVQGILAPGENILGASPGGKVDASSGTSYAASIVSGVAALLMSLQLKWGQTPDAQAVRSALIDSAKGCDDSSATGCRRLLAGRLNVKGAMSRVMQGGTVMTHPSETRQGFAEQIVTQVGLEPSGAHPVGAGVLAQSMSEEEVFPSEANTSSCSCGESEAPASGGGASAQLVHALGQLGFDFGAEVRRDSIAQHMGGNPSDPNQLLAYLDENPWDAESILWTLNLDATPVYAIVPQGVFASEGYQRLRQFLREQLTEGVERISLPGVLTGRARMMSGQVVPVVRPELRCMYSWTTAALVEAGTGEASKKPGEGSSEEAGSQRDQQLTNFLLLIYHKLRNLGLTSQERAINYAATNAFNVNRIFDSALKAKMELDTIEVERSPICRPNSDCWDVKLLFFDPENVLRSRKAFRFAVDVSDVCPVTVGAVRSWSVR